MTITKERLCTKEQLDLILRDNHEEIMSYIAIDNFCKQAQLALIERGNTREIVAYSNAEYVFCIEAQIKLVERNIYDEIIACIAVTKLSKSALSRIKNPQILAAYASVYCA